MAYKKFKIQTLKEQVGKIFTPQKESLKWQSMARRVQMGFSEIGRKYCQHRSIVSIDPDYVSLSFGNLAAGFGVEFCRMRFCAGV